MQEGVVLARCCHLPVGNMTVDWILNTSDAFFCPLPKPSFHVMQERVALARYCHLPVGNMTGNWILNTADALFARCLRVA